MSSLVYPAINSDITYTNVLLIDSEVPDFQSVYDSVNDETLPIVYSNSSSKVELLTLLNTHFRNISRIGFFFASSGMTKMFLDSQPFFSNSEETQYSENVEFIINIIKQFGVKNIDFLACNTLNLPNWISYYNLLTTETNVVVGASNDSTGNIKYGGDWVMETTCENIEFIYFTKTIEYYQYLLDEGYGSFIIDMSNTIHVTGHNSFGQLGLGNQTNQNKFTQIIPILGKKTVAISCGQWHTVVLYDDGTIYGAGNNGDGQLGLDPGAGSPTTFHPMIELPLGKKPVAISCGTNHTAALFNDGTVYTTGNNDFGQLGLGPTNSGDKNTLQPMIGLPSGRRAVAISCGSNYTVVLLSNGAIYGTGINNNGQLGLGNATSQTSLQPMIGLPSGKKAVAISCGTNHTVSLFNDGTIYATGNNLIGQLGVENTNIQYSLMQMIGLPSGTKAIAISCGQSHTVALCNDGTIYATGRNNYGQLGLGFSISIPTVTLQQMNIPLGKTAVAISCGADHTVALFDDGTIYANGKNDNGQLSLNDMNPRYILTQMLTLSDTSSLIPMINVNKLWDSDFVIHKIIIPISNVCFPANTPITTNQGIIAIQNLDPKIHTIGNKKIEIITKTITQDKYLVCFEKDALGKNVPSEKTIITKNHLIYYKDSAVKAKDFIDAFENVNKIKYNGEVLYNVLLKEHDNMIVNNLICETLHPDNNIGKFYKYISCMSQIEQQELIKKYNDYCIKNNIYSSKR